MLIWEGKCARSDSSTQNPNKELVVGRWWMKKGRQIDNDIGGKRSGAGGMKDMEARIVIHDQGIR
ncbi:hypothetical protein KSC_018020 [Ktedonobacter sp. SOSP1-52]|nr:hypothetical protein KSC_018020 [Ktedonobacter sp. SOSP1-52]